MGPGASRGVTCFVISRAAAFAYLEHDSATNDMIVCRKEKKKEIPCVYNIFRKKEEK